MLPKKGKDRIKLPWLSLTLVVVLAIGLIAVGTYYHWQSWDQPTVPLRYGELVQLCYAARHNPSIVLQKMKVHPSDITGEVAISDPVTDGTTDGRKTQVVYFRTMRPGARE